MQLTLSSRFKGPTSLKYILTSTFTDSPEIKRNMLHFNANDNKIGFMNNMIHTKFKAPWPARFESRYTGALKSGGQDGQDGNLDFAGIEKRTEIQMDNPLLLAHPEFSCFRHL